MGNTLDKSLLAAAWLRTALLTPAQVIGLSELRNGTRPFIEIGGLPMPGADSGRQPDEMAEYFTFGLIRLLGARPVAYTTENLGEIVREVRPKAETELQQSSQGAVALPMHTDLAYLRFPTEDSHPEENAAPDFLLLFCVQDTTKVPTTLLTIGQVESTVQDFAVLQNPSFTIQTPASVEPVRNHSNLPLVFDHQTYGLMMRFHPSVRLSAGGETNLPDELTSAADFATPIHWNPGKVLIFNNRRVLHGRPAIPVGQGAGIRHLIRIYAQRLDTRRVYTDEKRCILKG